MWRKIIRLWYNSTHGIRNIIRWIPIIWDDHDWDWVFLAQIMEYKLGRMAIEIGDRGHHLGRERNAKQMRGCQHLMKRIIADEYHENAQKGHPYKYVQHGMMMEKQDLEYFGKIFGKYFRHWWD